MERRQHNARHTAIQYLPFLAGLACCLLLWSGAHFPAWQGVAFQPAVSVSTVSAPPASSENATIRSAEPGRMNSHGDPWVDLTSASEDVLEEVDVSETSCVPVYIAEDVDGSSAATLGSRIPSRPCWSVPFYCLFEVYRL